MAIRTSTETSETMINIINNNLVVLDMPPPPPADANADSDANTISKLMQVALGGIGLGTFSAGSAGVALKDQLLAGAHNHAYAVTFFIILAVVYLASVVEMLAATRCVSLNGTTAKKITFVSLLLLLLLVAFFLVTYYLLNNH